MKPQIKNLIFTAAVTGLTYLIYLVKPEWSYWGTPYIIAFFAALLVINEKLQQGLNKGDNASTSYLASVSIRLILGALVAFLFIYFDRQHQILFVVHFFVLYLLFLGFEIFGL